MECTMCKVGKLSAQYIVVRRSPNKRPAHDSAMFQNAFWLSFGLLHLNSKQ